jgi:aerobic carbon-monoxide dehydrogenase medium subunit
MKLPKFDYARPKTLQEAVELLHTTEGAKVLSGGQSLIPVLAFRMSAPTLLVDIGGLDDLRKIKIDESGVSLGARVRWCDIEADERLQEAQPLLAGMIAHVAHYQVRNRGTVGGSLAHADPAAEMPGFAVTSDVGLVVVGTSGERTIAARDFFLGPLETALEADEILVEVRIPSWWKGRCWAFEEFARRRGDFALAGIAVFFDLREGGEVSNVHVGAIGAGSRPLRLPRVEELLMGKTFSESVIEEAGRTASEEVDPMDDVHAGSDYRRALVGTLTERAIRRAFNSRKMEFT